MLGKNQRSSRPQMGHMQLYNSLIIQCYHSNLPLIFLISHAQLISPRSVHITRLISNAVCSTTSLAWKRVNS